MNRAELQQRANDWVAGAETLLAAGQWSLAYYLAGYAVEFALKSCVLSRMIETGAVFREQLTIGGKQKKWEARDFRTHSLDELVDLAGLRAELDGRRSQPDGFSANWLLVREWRSDSRYERHEQSKAEDLLKAIAVDPDGVLSWVRLFW